jgi:hypothetical protein
MRPSLVFISLFACLAVAACSPADQSKTTGDIKSTASSLKDTVKEGGDSPAGEQLKADAKDLVKDAGTAIKKGAIQTKDALNSTVAKQQTPSKK